MAVIFRAHVDITPFYPVYGSAAAFHQPCQNFSAASFLVYKELEFYQLL